MGQGREGASISQHYSDSFYTANLCWFGSQTLPSGRGELVTPTRIYGISLMIVAKPRILTSLSHTLYVKPHVHTACSHEILFTTHTNLILTFNEKSNRCIQPRVYTLDTTEEVKLYENNNFSAVCQVLEII